MKVAMLDDRNEDVELWQSDVETSLPNDGDRVVFHFEGKPAAAWFVSSRTYVVMEDGEPFFILMLHPANPGEWDGSADRMVEEER